MKAIVHSWFTFKSDASALQMAHSVLLSSIYPPPRNCVYMLARNQRSNKTRARNNKCTASSPLRNHVRQCRSCTPILCNTTVCIIFVLYFGEGSMDWVDGARLCTIRTRFFSCKNKIVEKLHTYFLRCGGFASTENPKKASEHTPTIRTITLYIGTFIPIATSPSPPAAIVNFRYGAPPISPHPHMQPKLCVLHDSPNAIRFPIFSRLVRSDATR